MKHNVVKKLYSRRGAAVIISLLVFLLAVLSGTVALTMAASNVGRYTHEKDDQQTYLSVVSAANLILSRLDGVEIVYKASSGAPAPEDIVISYNNAKHSDLFLANEGFKQCLQAYSSAQGTAEAFEFSFSATDAARMGTVDVSVRILGGIFFFRLYSVDGSNRDYQITMQVKTTFTSGVGNFQEETDGYYRRMKFDMSGVTYAVEEGY